MSSYELGKKEPKFGTKEYAPPEYNLDDVTNTLRLSYDIWSFGCSLIFLFSGE